MVMYGVKARIPFRTKRLWVRQKRKVIKFDTKAKAVKFAGQVRKRNLLKNPKVVKIK